MPSVKTAVLLIALAIGMTEDLGVADATTVVTTRGWMPSVTAWFTPDDAAAALTNGPNAEAKAASPPPPVVTFVADAFSKGAKRETTAATWGLVDASPPPLSDEDAA